MKWSESLLVAKKSGSNTQGLRSRQEPASIPIDQVSPAVLTATRDVAFALERLAIEPEAEEILKAVLDRAEHLEVQASGISVLED